MRKSLLSSGWFIGCFIFCCLLTGFLANSSHINLPAPCLMGLLGSCPELSTTRRCLLAPFPDTGILIYPLIILSQAESPSPTHR
jgi:hypothetical protein